MPTGIFKENRTKKMKFLGGMLSVFASFFISVYLKQF